MQPEDHSQRTVIIGGGWAGLSAAIHLTRAGIPVTLLEASEQLGGRARMVMFNDLPMDNGQHIALGAYRHILELLQIIGLDEPFVFSRQALNLTVHDQNTTLKLKAPNLPAPFHLLFALLNAEGLSGKDKFKTIINWGRLLYSRQSADTTVTQLLEHTGQAEAVVRMLWEPLCIAAMNTPMNQASASVFQRVLKDAFMRGRKDSDLLLPRYDMGRVLPQPAQTWLTENRATILTHERVTALGHENGQINSVQTSHQNIACNNVILASNSWSSAKLLKTLPETADIAQNLGQFQYQPIATVYLRYERAVLLQPSMQGFVGTHMQWTFDRRITSHPKIIAIVISAEGEHEQYSKDELVEIVTRELDSFQLVGQKPIDSMVIREKRATFAATPEIETLRPENKTAIKGLFLAGDFTNTGYPATLEGAVISGKYAAQQLIQER